MPDNTEPLIKPQHEEVLASTVIGCLSTLRHKDGRISTNPVSYRWNGSEIEISSLKGRMKYKNMVAEPRATLERFLDALGHQTTLSYLYEAATRVLSETVLLPHVNPGVMTETDVASLRTVSVSQGLMLESASERLCRKGGPHYGSPDKRPSERLRTIAHAGEQVTLAVVVFVPDDQVFEPFDLHPHTLSHSRMLDC